MNLGELSHAVDTPLISSDLNSFFEPEEVFSVSENVFPDFKEAFLVIEIFFLSLRIIPSDRTIFPDLNDRFTVVELFFLSLENISSSRSIFSEREETSS